MNFLSAFLFGRIRKLYEDEKPVLFSGAYLQKCNFSGCEIVDGKFDNAFMQEAVFDKSTLTRADFTKAVMANNSFKGANVSHSTLFGLDATTDITGATFVDCTFVKCNLSPEQISSAEKIVMCRGLSATLISEQTLRNEK